MKRKISTHTLWSLGALAAFGLGHWSSRHFSASDQPGESEIALREAGAQSILDVPGPAAGEGAGVDGADGNEGEAALGSVLVPSATGSLSQKEIEQLAAEALSDPNPLKRSLAFSKLLESLTAENALAVMEAMRANRAGGREWNLFRYAWGAVDPEGALEHALSLEGRRQQEAVGETLTGWASSDPAGAMAWLEAMEDGDEKNRYRRDLVGGLADHDIGMATEYVLERAAQGDEQAGRYLETVTGEILRKGDVTNAVAWSEGLPDGALKGQAMDRVANRYVDEDPEAAARWAERYAEVEYGARVIEEVGDEWAERDPEAAVAWLQTLPQGRGASEGMESALGEWARSDPTSASEFLVTMPDSTTKDAAVSGFARNIVRENPQAAIAWAETINQEEMRLQTLTRTARQWFRRDSEAASAWLQSSGLPAEAQQQITRRGGRRG